MNNQFLKENFLDHREISKDLSIYSFSPDIGAGLPLYHSNGSLIKLKLEEFCRRVLLKHGYEMVQSPHIGKSRLWEISGHLEHFKEDMYAPIDIDGEQYFLKPMNCPFHMMIFNSKRRFHSELPMRLAEFGMVYRYERSGSLHGLARLRGFVQDDAHIFCLPHQLSGEVENALKLSRYVLHACGIDDVSVFLSSRPKSGALGSESEWRLAENVLEESLIKLKIPFERDEGGGAFYGPKIDVKIKDRSGKFWQLSSIQFDFNLPRRFDLKVVLPDGKESAPYIIHRAFFGSIDRFLAVLLEKHQGLLPYWLSPVQSHLLVLGENNLNAAEKFVEKVSDLRVKISLVKESLSVEIKRAQKNRPPFILVLGDKDVRKGVISVRERQHDKSQEFLLNEAVDLLKAKCAEPITFCLNS